MFRPIMGFDERKSNAHLLFLSKFVHPRSPNDFVQSEDWKNVLGEHPIRAIERLYKGGLLAARDFSDGLSYKYDVSGLKDTQKIRRSPVSGRKEEMIQRLVEEDPVGIKKAIDEITVFVCTQQGADLANEYLAAEKENRAQAEQQTIEYIRNQDFKKASLEVAVFETEQVFPRGIGIEWQHHNPDRDIRLLTTIFNAKPKILSKLGNEKMEDLRLGASMMALWGENTAYKWLPSTFNTGLSLDVDTAARMIFFHAIHQEEMKQLRESGFVKFVEIFNNNPDSCKACKNLANRIYRLEEVPELPYEHCTSEMGCRCLVSAIID